MMERLRVRVADFVARQTLQRPLLERALVAACRSPIARKNLRVGAVAMAYARLLDAPEERIAQFDSYKMLVNVAEHLGLAPFFFGDTGTLWPTRDLFRPGDVCIDAGANIGHYTFFMASLLGAHGKVISFEPNPPYADRIVASAALNGWSDRVVVERCALSDRAQKAAHFYVSTNTSNSGTSSLVDHGFFVEPDNYIDVETRTLDEYTRDAGIERLALVKIDVERAEHTVLRGMHGLLSERRVDFLIVELFPDTEAQRILEEQGYRVYMIDESTKSLIDASRMPRGVCVDILAISPAKQAYAERRFEGRMP